MTYGRAVGGILYLTVAYLTLFQFPYMTNSVLITVARVVMAVLLAWATIMAGIRWFNSKKRKQLADEGHR